MFVTHVLYLLVLLSHLQMLSGLQKESVEERMEKGLQRLEKPKV